MEHRQDMHSIIQHLPLTQTLEWPSQQIIKSLKSLSLGPQHSKVDSGQSLSLFISNSRISLSLSSHPFSHNALQGYTLFFDQLISREDSTNWFERVIPRMASLLLKLPYLLEQHYQNAESSMAKGDKVRTSLRILESQEGGIVFLSQELIGALLACAFFCFFPSADRYDKHLPNINFDRLFAFLYDKCSEKQENKIRCIIHYFERICSCMPTGFVSFERKVLPYENKNQCMFYPKADNWSKSTVPLCHIMVHHSGLIENQSSGALEVDFANRYLGGGALRGGCVQEEIRFMINPELIAGMLFLPSMEDNETIEIVGAERFSDYTGYASSFRFVGDYVDKRGTDNSGRHNTRIVAMDALSQARTRQYRSDCLLREINKAFCGFLDHTNHKQYRKLFQEGEHPKAHTKSHDTTGNDLLLDEASSSLDEVNSSSSDLISTGIATGNWGCGAFGGDPEVKSIIQWLAASQASRPFILYYTFGLEALKNLDQVSQWIISNEWTVGDLWNMLVEYCTQKVRKETKLSFFTWLLPNPPVANSD